MGDHDSLRPVERRVLRLVAAAAGPLAFLGLGEQARAPRTARHVHCSLDGAPLQPDRC